MPADGERATDRTASDRTATDGTKPHGAASSRTASPGVAPERAGSAPAPPARAGDGGAAGPAPHEARLMDQGGRPLGPRAVATRRRLLDETAALLDACSARDVSVVEIARRAGTSPATFYQYFQDVEQAALELAREAAAEVPRSLDALRGDWQGAAGLDAARTLVEAFVARWDQHRAVLLFANVAAEQGDPRFRAIRTEAMYPLIEALAAKLRASRADGADGAGGADDGIHPVAAAAALAAILERLAAYHHELEALGVGRAEVVATVARMLHQTVTGQGAA